MFIIPFALLLDAEVLLAQNSTNALKLWQFELPEEVKTRLSQQGETVASSTTFQQRINQAKFSKASLLSPCSCSDPTSCDGMVYADETSALMDYNTMAGPPTNPLATGCYDLSADNIPADDGNVFEFCYQYTHSSTEPSFAVNGDVLSSLPASSNCDFNSAVELHVYSSGNCGVEEASFAVTSNLWPVYSATTGQTYELCWTFKGNPTHCAGGTISSVCTFVYPYTSTSCSLFGGNIQGEQYINYCYEVGSMIPLSTVNAVTSADYPDIAWGLWLLADPLGNDFGTPGPIPPDFNPLDDLNFLGIWSETGADVMIPNYANGATYYFAPFIINEALTSLDPACTGISTGYTVHMNLAIASNITVMGCDVTLAFEGGYPATYSAADYVWEVVAPDGTITTGTGDSLLYTSTNDGFHTFSLLSDGLGNDECQLLEIYSIELACSCDADAGTFTHSPNTLVNYGDSFTILTDGNWSGEMETGNDTDVLNPPFSDGDSYNGVFYGIYVTDVISQNPLNDQANGNLIGVVGASPATVGGNDEEGVIQNEASNLAALGLSPNTPYFFTTIYAFDVDDGIMAVDLDKDGLFDCWNVNTADVVEVIFLDDIVLLVEEVCTLNNTIEITLKIDGGLPAYDNRPYTVTQGGNVSYVDYGDDFVLSNFPAASSYSIVVSDGNSASKTVSGPSSCPVAVEDIPQELEKFIVYPSIFSDMLTIDLSNYNKKVEEIALYDVSGRPVKNTNLSLTKPFIEWNVEDLPAGIYLLRVNEMTRKLVKH